MVVRSSRLRDVCGLVGFGVTCLVGSFTLAWLALRPASRMGLLADRLEHDFGTLRQVEAAETNFVVTNRCPESVEIIDVTASCGCTAVVAGRNRLAPGESTHLAVRLDTGTARGVRSSWIDVVYRRDGSPRLEHLALRVRVKVEPDYYYEPSQIVFALGRPARTTIRLWPGALKDFSITQASCPRQGLTINTVAPSDDDQVWILEVSYSPQEFDTVFDRAEIVIRTNSQRQPVCHIGVGFAETTQRKSR